LVEIHVQLYCCFRKSKRKTIEPSVRTSSLMYRDWVQQFAAARNTNDTRGDANVDGRQGGKKREESMDAYRRRRELKQRDRSCGRCAVGRYAAVAVALTNELQRFRFDCGVELVVE